MTRIGAYIRYFWDIHLKDHFDEEEQWLFVAGDAQCAQAIAEHRRLQALQETIAANAVTGDVEAFADLLDRHIRFEERILFPHLEQTLSAEKMAVIGTALEASHKKTGQDDYPDAFWLDT